MDENSKRRIRGHGGKALLHRERLKQNGAAHGNTHPIDPATTALARKPVDPTVNIVDFSQPVRRRGWNARAVRRLSGINALARWRLGIRAIPPLAIRRF